MLTGSDNTLLQGKSPATATRPKNPVIRTIAAPSVKQARECIALSVLWSRCGRKMPPAAAAQQAALSERLGIMAGHGPGSRAQPPGGRLRNAEELQRVLFRRSDGSGERSRIAAGEDRPSGPSTGFRWVYATPDKYPDDPMRRLVHALLPKQITSFVKSVGNGAVPAENTKTRYSTAPGSAAKKPWNHDRYP